MLAPPRGHGTFVVCCRGNRTLGAAQMAREAARARKAGNNSGVAKKADVSGSAASTSAAAKIAAPRPILSSLVSLLLLSPASLDKILAYVKQRKKCFGFFLRTWKDKRLG